MRTAPSLLVLLLGACGGDNSVGVFNTPPEASIVSPPDGTTVDEGQVVTFEALVDDDFDDGDKLGIRWSSSRDGEFTGPFVVEQGYARLETANLTPGNHDVTIVVTDSKGASGTDTIQVVVNDLPEAPDVSVVRPAQGEAGVEGEAFEFVVQVADSKDSPDQLVLSFESDVDGVFCEPTADATGVARCDATLSPDTHTLVFTALDSEGYEAAATALFVVTARTAIDDDGDGYAEEDGDCDDADGSVHPGATEVYNDRDDDCDDLVDEGTQGYDDDGDGFSEVDGDCDDADDDTYPGATERCDDADNDCDTTVDEETVCYDDDGDGWTEIDGDCDDESAASYPGASELADGEDNDCDGTVDEGTEWYDDDGDGYAEIDGDCNDSSATIHPAATETCGDGVDNDCDSTADEENASGCTRFYYDYDGDGYGVSTTSKCLCSSSGYYTSRYSSDCYDYNSSANPGQTSWFTSSRGDGSYDYNCDGSQSKYWTDTYDCPSYSVGSCQTGWDASSSASCGSSRTYVTSCTNYFFGCVKDSTATRTQKCR